MSCWQIGLSEDALAPYLAPIAAVDNISVGCINSPVKSTVTGSEKAVATLEELLGRENVSTYRLPMSTTYHSPHMQQIAMPYLTAIQQFTAPAKLHFADNVPQNVYFGHRPTRPSTTAIN